MSSEEIVKYGDQVLRSRAAEIERVDEDTRALIERMYVALEASKGLGVAAPQVGVSKRAFVYDIGEGKHALLNPRIVRSSGEEILIEGCLSIPGLQGEVARADRVTVTGIDETGRKVRIKANGLLARVFQHEIDHLDGTMFIDRADPETLRTVPLTAEGEEAPEEEL